MRNRSVFWAFGVTAFVTSSIVHSAPPVKVALPPPPAAAAAPAPALVPVPAPAVAAGVAPVVPTPIAPPSTQMKFGLPKNLAVPAPGAATGDGKKVVHVLLIGHVRNSRGIGDGVLVTAQKIEQLFYDSNIFNANELTIQTVGLPEDTARPATTNVPARTNRWLSVTEIDRAINQINADADDAIFCYVMCHGAYDGNHGTPDYEYGHWFEMEIGTSSYPRVNLSEKLLSKNARLTVLMSDSCNVRVDLTNAAPAPASADVNLTSQAFAGLRSLLLDHRGIVSLSATSQGEFSFYYADRGGFFSNTWIETLRWASPNVTWHEFFSQVQSDVESAFWQQWGSRGGYPYAFVNGQVVSAPPAQPQRSFTPKAMRSLNLVLHGVSQVGATPPMTQPMANPLGFPVLPPSIINSFTANQIASLEALKGTDDAKKLTELVKEVNTTLTAVQRAKRAENLKVQEVKAKKGEAAQREALVRIEPKLADGVIEKLITNWKSQQAILKKLRKEISDLLTDVQKNHPDLPSAIKAAK